jgi:KUP system potassium uptake protein
MNYKKTSKNLSLKPCGDIKRPIASKISAKTSPIILSVIVALGIVYGDIGTSPLYVMRAIISGKMINELLIYGSLSCIFWTLTLQTTLKYIIIVLKVDRKGQGGMLALYSLIKGKKWWIVFFAMIGASMILSEGLITPAISVSSAVEGLKIIYPQIQTMPIVITILLVLFSVQKFGTNVVGGLFGVIMLFWFLTIGILGLSFILENPFILKAINPFYGIKLLSVYPGGFWILGAVFLCTTGAEALYSDLGHCDRKSIRIGWVFVKICLLLNYFGQGSWLLNHSGEILQKDINPFYSIIPEWFLLPSIFLATFATIIASQALISGSFSLISEANRLNLWPKLRTLYPATKKGQIYIPAVNTILCIGCIGVTYYFKESANMEAAYGLAVITAMINTTILFAFYLSSRKAPKFIVYSFLILYLIIESAFLIAGAAKFVHGGWVVFLGGFLIFATMWIWYQAKVFKRRHIKYANMKKALPILKNLSSDNSVPKSSTHLVYMTSSAYIEEIETKIIYSLLDRQPKRADIYWFVHVEIVDEPYICDYKVTVMSKESAVRIDFRLGFKVEPRINILFKKVVAKLIRNKEIDFTIDYNYEGKQNISGDITFVILKKFISNKHYLPFFQRFLINAYYLIDRLSISEQQYFGIDDEPNSVIIEQVPIKFISNRKQNLIKLNRVYE